MPFAGRGPDQCECRPELGTTLGGNEREASISRRGTGSVAELIHYRNRDHAPVTNESDPRPSDIQRELKRRCSWPSRFFTVS